MEKFVFSIGTMTVCLILNNVIDSLIILFLMSYITVAKGKVPFFTFVKFLSLPLSFLFIGVLTIAINVVGNSNDVLFSFRIFTIHLACTYESLSAAGVLFFKSIASVSCLYFLTLSTPVFEILAVLKKLKVPRLFLELMGLVYRLIFVLLDTANLIYISQSSRLGYSTLRIGYHSLGKLITSLFVSSYKRSLDMYTAMESRCYDGDINLLENNFTCSYKNIGAIICVELILIVIGSFEKIFGGIGL
nr:cobalt ECF transporter T component CbiQ [Neobacillus massiliamazoniensis]